ncbi:S-layer protein [Candidatus Woesearchaeota archaeon]|nr:S-layer protein [Candidatus Woesearchaeota archaeon]
MKLRSLYSLLSMVLALFFSSFLMPQVDGADLHDYPDLFFADGHFNGLLVVGDYANAADVVGVTYVALSLQAYSNTAINVEAVRLASEITNVSAQNLIVVGGPCINTVAAELMDYPVPCTKGFSQGMGSIQLYEHPNGNIAILVAGLEAIDTKRAALVLAKYDQYQISGTNVEVTTSTEPQILIR